MKRAVAVLLAATSFSTLAAEDVSTQAEAQERRKSIVAIIKSKGADAAALALGATDDPLKCKYKDMVCMVMDFANGKIVAHTAMPKLAGSKYDEEMVDVDGVPIAGQQVGPARQGKTVWEARWKFARPDTKKITPRWATCEKADPSHVVCVSIAQI